MKKNELQEIYSPKYYNFYLTHEDKCYIGNAPTIGKACKEYSFEEVCCVVNTCILELLEFNGSRMKDGQLSNLIQAIVAGFPHLKLSELMLFFCKFRIGEYGKLFQVIYPGDIVCPLRTFYNDAMRKRGELLANVAQARSEELRERMSKERVSAAAAAEWWSRWEVIRQNLKKKK